MLATILFLGMLALVPAMFAWSFVSEMLDDRAQRIAWKASAPQRMAAAAQYAAEWQAHMDKVNARLAPDTRAALDRADAWFA